VKMKPNVGDKVRLVSEDILEYVSSKDYYFINGETTSLISDMKKFLGCIVTISRVEFGSFEIKEDPLKYSWSNNLIQEIVENNTDTYGFIKFGEFYIAFNKDSLIAVQEFFNSKEEFWEKYKKEGN
jgi:hypothetical protein